MSPRRSRGGYRPMLFVSHAVTRNRFLPRSPEAGRQTDHSFSGSTRRISIS